MHHRLGNTTLLQMVFPGEATWMSQVRNPNWTVQFFFLNWASLDLCGFRWFLLVVLFKTVAWMFFRVSHQQEKAPFSTQQLVETWPKRGLFLSPPSNPTWSRLCMPSPALVRSGRSSVIQVNMSRVQEIVEILWFKNECKEYEKLWKCQRKAKKGNLKQCQNYRTNSLISHSSKIML